MRQIRGKNVLVTGAASGIGRSLALRLASEGANVCLMDIDDAGMEEVAGQIRQLGSRVAQLQCDIGRQDDTSACIHSILERWNNIDILVNNAGVVYYGPTLSMTADQWDWLLRINLLGPIHVTRMLLPSLLARPEAHILNVCSIYGVIATGRAAAYHVSKFGLVGFSKSLRAEFGHGGLGVTALCPGYVRTKLFRSGLCGHKGRDVPEPPRWLCSTPERVATKGIKAIYRDRPMVFVGPMAHFLYHTNRLCPWMNELPLLASRAGRRWKKAKVVDPNPETIDPISDDAHSLLEFGSHKPNGPTKVATRDL